MGCSGSKLEELEAVALCRSRTELLAEAIRHRYALADAHSAYAFSLRSVGASLHRFLDSSVAAGGGEGRGAASASPSLPLPAQRKGDPLPPSSPPAAVAHSRSHSGSGSHIQFHSSSEDDDGEHSGSESHDSPPQPENSVPNRHDFGLHDYNNYYYGQSAETLGPTYTNFHYARNQPQPSTVHFAPVPGGDPSPSYSSPPPPYPNYTNHPYSYPHAYPSNNYYGFFGASSSSTPPSNLAPPPPVGESSASAAKPPLPPPPPPSVSTWDFLNPFQGQDDNYYPLYTPSRSSREVRDEEGIPDLEDEDDEDHEDVKEVHGVQKFVGSAAGEYRGNEEEGIASVVHNSRPVAQVENTEDVVEKKVVADERARPQQSVANSSKPRRYQDVSEIGSEIRMQFERASEAASELSKALEIGKHPYRHHRKPSVIEVSSRMMCVMPSSTSTGEDFLTTEEDITTSSGNLSLTLQKLYIWEKKLQDEVRAEEKTRLDHDRCQKRFTHLAERGAEAQKLEEVQRTIKKLSTKIRIAIQVVDSISNKINKIRDEELWPQITDLIQGMVRMWKVMLECHRIQSQAVSEAKSLDRVVNGGKPHTSIIMDLELELLRWAGNFSTWINAQKNYVRALNGWLILCLHYEPEVTADGVAPYSPGRIGAPPVFGICNSWAQAVERISEMEVIIAVQAFAANLKHILEPQSIDPYQVMLNGDRDRSIRARERESQIIHKEMDALNKKLVLVSGQNDLSGNSLEASNLQIGLKQVFEAVENFSGNSFKAYEEVKTLSEEETTKLGG